jgi:hypothetical protein
MGKIRKLHNLRQYRHLPGVTQERHENIKISLLGPTSEHGITSTTRTSARAETRFAEVTRLNLRWNIFPANGILAGEESY